MPTPPPDSGFFLIEMSVANSYTQGLYLHQNDLG